jgi:hypothetical protein
MDMTVKQITQQTVPKIDDPSLWSLDYLFHTFNENACVQRNGILAREK